MASNPLTDALPVKYRKAAYALAALASLAYSAWQAADGNWGQFGGGLAAALITALAHGNAAPTPVVNVVKAGGGGGTTYGGQGGGMSSGTAITVTPGPTPKPAKKAAKRTPKKP